MGNRFVIMTEYFDSKNQKRQDEVIKSIEVNCRIAETKRVVIFLNCDQVLPTKLRDVLSEESYKKIKVHYTRPGSRAVYADFFAYANEHLTGERCILCNNDISFDETLGSLDEFDLEGHFLCLTRWDVMRDNSLRFKHPERMQKNSQDAWVFKSPLPIEMLIKPQFHMGKPGCDGMIAYTAHTSNLKVINPSKIIRAKHLHLSSHRTYTNKDRIGRDPVLLCIYPTELLEYDKTNLLYKLNKDIIFKGEEASDVSIQLKDVYENIMEQCIRRSLGG